MSGACCSLRHVSFLKRHLRCCVCIGRRKSFELVICTNRLSKRQHPTPGPGRFHKTPAQERVAVYGMHKRKAKDNFPTDVIALVVELGAGVEILLQPRAGEMDGFSLSSFPLLVRCLFKDMHGYGCKSASGKTR